MEYDISDLLSTHACRIVLANGVPMDIIRHAVIRSKPIFRTETDPAFLPSKVGPFTFKKKKSVWDILMTTKDAADCGPAFLQKVIPQLDLRVCEDRYPHVLQEDQLERASVLYEILNHRFCFLIDDSTTILDAGDVPNGYLITRFLKDYMGDAWARCELIWLTYMPEKVLLEKLGQEQMQDPFYEFFAPKNGKIVKYDKTALWEKHFPKPKAPQKRLTAVDFARPRTEAPKPAPEPPKPAPAPEPSFNEKYGKSIADVSAALKRINEKNRQ